MKLKKIHFMKFFEKYCNLDKLKQGYIWRDWQYMMKNILPIKRQPEFFSQCCYESNYFKKTAENLMYSSAERILKVFHRVKTLKQAEKLVYEPEKLAKVAYYSHPRLGNNSEGAKKLYARGWKVYDFRGKGYIQVTGYNNWMSFYNDTGIEIFSDYTTVNIDGEFETMHRDYFQKRPWLASGWWWIKHDVDYCGDMRDMTRIINGGTNGIKKRMEIYKNMLQIMKENQ